MEFNMIYKSSLIAKLFLLLIVPAILIGCKEGEKAVADNKQTPPQEPPKFAL